MYVEIHSQVGVDVSHWFIYSTAQSVYVLIILHTITLDQRHKYILLYMPAAETGPEVWEFALIRSSFEKDVFKARCVDSIGTTWEFTLS